jgi:hypothetical protein
MGGHKLSNGLYTHPAFFPHFVLKRMGVAGFWWQNTIVSITFIAALTLSAWVDGSLVLGPRGFGFLEHPGIFGWFVIQLWMPVTLYRLVKESAARKDKWKRIATANGVELNEAIVRTLFAFIGFKTAGSRLYFSLLFTFGFAAFAWNSFQNAHPGVLAPLDFWDSINFRYGYYVSRVHKFYLDAFLLPTAVHLFTAVVWVQFRLLRRFTIANRVRIAPFDADRCGGLGFMANTVLAPAISAILVSGIILFGAIYTHRAFDISTAMGAGVTLVVFIIFYLLPTLSLKSSIDTLKRRESDIIFSRQETYYRSMLSGELHGTELGEAKDYLKYFEDVRARIDAVPTFPHFAQVFGALSFALVLPMLTAFVNLSAAVAKGLIHQP